MTEPKMPRKKPKTIQTCYSTFPYMFPFHKLCLYKTTTKHQNYVPNYSNRLSQNNARKAKNKTNLQQRVLLRITLSKITLLQNDTNALKIMFPAAKNDWAKNAKKKPKTKKTCYSTFPYIFPFHKLCLYKTTLNIKNYVPSC